MKNILYFFIILIVIYSSSYPSSALGTTQTCDTSILPTIWPSSHIYVTDTNESLPYIPLTYHTAIFHDDDVWNTSTQPRAVHVTLTIKDQNTGQQIFNQTQSLQMQACSGPESLKWRFVPIQVTNYIATVSDNRGNVGMDFNSILDVTKSQTVSSPLEQLRFGVDFNSVICRQDLQLVIKSEGSSPACVKSDTVQKLMEKGWAKEIVSKISQIKNQVISIGNDTYDTIEFQTMTGNTISLDNVKFTYRGASPLNNNCYPDLTNQKEARDFEMIPGNISDMNTHQCWPPSNYPPKITNENTIPTDLFSKYSINFFDYNQTIGVGWCHSDSCYLGQTLYLVKRSWDTPVTYDDPVSLLEFHLGTNASAISSGQAIAINMSASNKLPKTILVPSEYNYSFKGTGLGPCTYRPFDLAILEGFYGENNFTQGNKLSLYQPGIYSCPVSIAPQGYKFEPMSNNVVDRCEPFDGCSNTGQIQFHTSFSGSWNNTSFHKFKSGVYTLIAGDEWGHFAIQHFVVTNSNRN